MKDLHFVSLLKHIVLMQNSYIWTLREGLLDSSAGGAVRIAHTIYTCDYCNASWHTNIKKKLDNGVYHEIKKCNAAFASTRLNRPSKGYLKAPNTIYTWAIVCQLAYTCMRLEPNEDQGFIVNYLNYIFYK